MKAGISDCTAAPRLRGKRSLSRFPPLPGGERPPSMAAGSSGGFLLSLSLWNEARPRRSRDEKSPQDRSGPEGFAACVAGTGLRVPLPAGGIVLSGVLAAIPDVHVLHFLTAHALQGFAGKRRIFAKAPLFLVLLGCEIVDPQVAFGDHLELLAALKTGHGIFPDGFSGIQAFSINFFFGLAVVFRVFVQCAADSANKIIDVGNNLPLRTWT